ncbi:hypothetical protein B0T18DRAFT_40301 [Schizothecium vesticola]|uniref:Uncharacterized protein n=1 Tax=Schizothecium vesticola TaxID=314040 RepID=A0AA40FB90_9PEZI|nr:hypothetical protein B0T18DRAFT_40301 [Schizothecium vesticola]
MRRQPLARWPTLKKPPPPATPLHVLTRRQGDRDPGRGWQTRQGSKRFQLLAPLPCHTKSTRPVSFLPTWPLAAHAGTPGRPWNAGVLGGTSNAPVSGPSPSSPVTLVSTAAQRYLRETDGYHADGPENPPPRLSRLLPDRPSPAAHCAAPLPVAGQAMCPETSCPCNGTVLAGAFGPRSSRCHSAPVGGGGHDGEVGVWTKTHLQVACPGPAWPCDGFPGLDSKAGTPWPVLLKVHTYIPSAASLAGEPLYIVRRLMSSWPSSTPLPPGQ